MKRIPWHYLLPVGNAALAAALLYMGFQQRTEYLADKLSAWDYTPTAVQAVYMINFPAFVVWSAIRNLFPPGTLIQNGGLLLLTIPLWYLIGLRAANRASFANLTRRSRASMLVIYACGVAGTATLGFVAVNNLMVHPLLGLAGLCWCVCLIWSIAITMRRRARERQQVAHQR
jgi:hypothetical protein